MADCVTERDGASRQTVASNHVLREATETERQEIRGSGVEFGPLLNIKRIPVKGAAHVSMQGCTCGGAGGKSPNRERPLPVPHISC